MDHVSNSNNNYWLPQGSVLGPHLFRIYVSQLDEGTIYIVAIKADGTRRDDSASCDDTKSVQEDITWK